MGTNSYHDTEIYDRELIECFEKDERKIIDEMFEEFAIKMQDVSSEGIWFELHEEGKGCIGTMKVVWTDTYFEMDGDLEDLSEECRDVVYNNMTDYSENHDPCFCFDNQKVELTGVFKGKKTNCYREGICLREFTYLVCDYLGEERIERTY